MNLEKAERILIIRFSALGDILLTTPFVRVLKKKYPNLKIDYFIKSAFVDAVRLNPNLNEIYSWDNEGEFSEGIERLIENNYDFVVDLQNNLRSKRVKRKIGAESTSFKKPNIKKFLLVLEVLDNDGNLPFMRLDQREKA